MRVASGSGSLFGAAGVAALLWAAPALAVWEPGVQISIDAPGTFQGDPDIVRGPGDVLYVVYSSNKTGDNDIYLRCSTDKGATWSAEQNLFLPGNRAGSQVLPKVAAALAADNSTIRLVVAFRTDVGAVDFNPAIVRLTGPTVASPCTVDQAAPEAFSQTNNPEGEVDVDIDRAGNVYLVHRADIMGGQDNDAVYFVEIPFGTTLQQRGLQLVSAVGNMTNPAIIVSGANDVTSRVVITMVERQNGGGGTPGDLTPNIAIAWSHDGGATFAGFEPSSTAAVAADSPSVDFHEFSGPTVYQAWKQGTSDVMVSVLDLTGATATTITPATKVNITGSIVTLGGVSSFANTGDAMVLYSAGVFPNYDILSAFTTNTGGTWSEGLVSNAANSQNFPRSAIGSSYAVYNSDQDLASTVEVYFSRDITGGVTATRVEDLAAERADGGVRISWRLVDVTNVESMRVTRGDAEPVGEELAPGLTDTFSLVDENPVSAGEYWLEVHLAGGGMERVGPVSPGAAEGEPEPAGCGRGWLFGALVVAAVRARPWRWTR